MTIRLCLVLLPGLLKVSDLRRLLEGNNAVIELERPFILDADTAQTLRENLSNLGERLSANLARSVQQEALVVFVTISLETIAPFSEDMLAQVICASSAPEMAWLNDYFERRIVGARTYPEFRFPEKYP